MPYPSPTGVKPRGKTTFIEDARRRQILDVALDEIAAKGYQNTSLQEIADKARISKGVIYYHFNGKHELLNSIWSALVDELFEFRRTRVETQTSARNKLRCYVQANFEFVERNLNKFKALFRMGIDLEASDERPNPWSRERNQRCLSFVVSILREGQQNGDFQAFSPEVIAPVIQGAIDGFCLQGISDPDLDQMEASRKVLLDIIETYTAKPDEHHEL